MLRNILPVTLNLLTLRAGPQDFPYEPRLTGVLVPLTVLAGYLVQVIVMPPVLAASTSLATVLGLALATRMVLRVRKLEARFLQTFHSLLAVTAVMTLIFWPLMAELAPFFQAYSKVMDDPVAIAKLDAPAGPLVMVLVLAIWNFVVNARIFRDAAGLSPWRGVWVTLLVAFGLQVFASLLVSLVSAATGVVPHGTP